MPLNRAIESAAVPMVGDGQVPSGPWFMAPMGPLPVARREAEGGGGPADPVQAHTVRTGRQPATLDRAAMPARWLDLIPVGPELAGPPPTPLTGSELPA